MDPNGFGFWEALDRLVEGSRVIVDRPKGSGHPRYPGFVYGLDYGYLDGTVSSDGEGIDVWIGTMEAAVPTAVIVTVDLVQRDSEIKILLGCTDEEIDYVYGVHNETDDMRGALIRRSPVSDDFFIASRMFRGPWHSSRTR